MHDSNTKVYVALLGGDGTEVKMSERVEGFFLGSGTERVRRLFAGTSRIFFPDSGEEHSVRNDYIFLTPKGN